MRSLSNFYSIESLKISYVITNSELSKVIQEKNMVNQIDKLSERLAITVVKDKKYQTETRNKIKTENEYVSKTLNDSNVKFIESDTHLILVDTYRNKNDIIEDLENENYLLYTSNDEVGNYWTLPISMRRVVNEKLTSVINYSM